MFETFKAIQVNNGYRIMLRIGTLLRKLELKESLALRSFIGRTTFDYSKKYIKNNGGH